MTWKDLLEKLGLLNQSIDTAPQGTPYPSVPAPAAGSPASVSAPVSVAYSAGFPAVSAPSYSAGSPVSVSAPWYSAGSPVPPPPPPAEVPAVPLEKMNREELLAQVSSLAATVNELVSANQAMVERFHADQMRLALEPHLQGIPSDLRDFVFSQLTPYVQRVGETWQTVTADGKPLLKDGKPVSLAELVQLFKDGGLTGKAYPSLSAHQGQELPGGGNVISNQTGSSMSRQQMREKFGRQTSAPQVSTN